MLNRILSNEKISWLSEWQVVFFLHQIFNIFAISRWSKISEFLNFKWSQLSIKNPRTTVDAIFEISKFCLLTCLKKKKIEGPFLFNTHPPTHLNNEGFRPKFFGRLSIENLNLNRYSFIYQKLKWKAVKWTPWGLFSKTLFGG